MKLQLTNKINKQTKTNKHVSDEKSDIYNMNIKTNK